MLNDHGTRHRKSFSNMLADGNVRRGSSHKGMPGKCREYAHQTLNLRNFRGPAFSALREVPCLKVSRANQSFRLKDQKAIRANCLIAVMLDRHRLAPQQ